MRISIMPSLSTMYHFLHRKYTEKLIASSCQHFINVGIQYNFSTLYHKIGFVPYDFAYLQADYQLFKGELLDL